MAYKILLQKRFFITKIEESGSQLLSSPIYIDGHNDNWLKNSHSGYIQIQRLHTVQTRSRLSGLDESFSVRRYRGKLGGHYINYYGIYRYRLVKNGKKTQWRTISIMNNIDTNGRWDLFSIK